MPAGKLERLAVVLGVPGDGGVHVNECGKVPPLIFVVMAPLLELPCPAAQLTEVVLKEIVIEEGCVRVNTVCEVAQFLLSTTTSE